MGFQPIITVSVIVAGSTHLQIVVPRYNASALAIAHRAAATICVMAGARSAHRAVLGETPHVRVEAGRARLSTIVTVLPSPDSRPELVEKFAEALASVLAFEVSATHRVAKNPHVAVQ